MKTHNIIKKNIKLLLRSRVSMFVLILGPLLIIMLAGISFSTNNFSLKIGAFSESYSELSNTLSETLAGRYTLIKYASEESCVGGVKEGAVQACVVFPPQMEIKNDIPGTVKMHVDQSQINLVYLVRSTLAGSLGEQSSEISKDLTDKVITSMLFAKTGLESSRPLLEEIIAGEDLAIKTATDAEKSLRSLDLSGGGEISVETETEAIRQEIDSLLEKTADFVEEGLDTIDDLGEWVEPNGTAYIDNLESDLKEFNSSMRQGHNSTMLKLNSFLEDISESYTKISEKLSNADTVNKDAAAKARALSDNAASLKKSAEELDTKITAALGNINSVEVTNAESISTPFFVEVEETAKSSSNLSFLFPSLIVMLIMFIGLLLPSTLIIMEKNSRANFRVFMTPTRNWLFVSSTYLTSMLLIFFQIVIIFFVSHIYFKIGLAASFMSLLFSLFIIMSFFILLGMLIGYIFNSEEMAMLASSSVGTLLLLTSGIIFPLESMPSYLIEKARFNPMVLGSDLLKKALLFASEFSSMKPSLIYLTLFSLAVLAAILIVRRSDKIGFFLKKPSTAKLKRDFLSNQFDFGERKAKTLAEFIVSVQGLSEERYSSLLSQGAYSGWLLYVYKSKELAKKAEAIKLKQELIKMLVDELKRLSEKR